MAIRKKQDTHMHTHTHTHAHTCTHAHTRAHTCMHTRTRTHMHAHTRTHTHTHACTHAHAHTCMHTRAHTRAHMHAHTCAYTRAHTQTHTCTHTQTHTCTHTCTFWLGGSEWEGREKAWTEGGTCLGMDLTVNCKLGLTRSPSTPPQPTPCPWKPALLPSQPREIFEHPKSPPQCEALSSNPSPIPPKQKSKQTNKQTKKQIPTLILMMEPSGFMHVPSHGSRGSPCPDPCTPGAHLSWVLSHF
jgi:hypothetical protein